MTGAELDEADERREDVGRLIASLAGGVARLGPGERALLRRPTFGAAPSPAALGLTARLLTAAGAGEKDLTWARIGRFALLLRLMALLAGTREENQANPHRRGATLGQAYGDLLTGGGKRRPEEVDARLLMLVAAQGEVFDTLLERAIRRLAASGEGALDQVELWRLIEWPGSERAGRARLAVARDFYRRAPHRPSAT